MSGFFGFFLRFPCARDIRACTRERGLAEVDEKLAGSGKSCGPAELVYGNVVFQRPLGSIADVTCFQDIANNRCVGPLERIAGISVRA